MKKKSIIRQSKDMRYLVYCLVMTWFIMGHEEETSFYVQQGKKSIKSCHMICWVTKLRPVQWFLQVMEKEKEASKRLGEHNSILGTFELELQAFEVIITFLKQEFGESIITPKPKHTASNKNDFLGFHSWPASNRTPLLLQYSGPLSYALLHHSNSVGT